MSIEPLVPVLQVAGLCKSYDVQVFRAVSLEVNRGDVVAILGPSGAGKTTLLRCISGLTPVDAGTVWFMGDTIVDGERDLGDVQTRARRTLGHVSQEWDLLPHLSVLDNVALGPHVVKGMSKKDARNLAAQFCESVGLGDKLRSSPMHLSGGQKQRVALARALAMEPQLLMLDEITAALDPGLVVEILDLIAAKVAVGRATIIVTHHVAFARRVANKGLFLAGAHVAEEGAVPAMLDSPRSDELTRFLEALSKLR